MLLKVDRELIVHKAVHEGADVGVAELLLGLPFKLCLGELDGDNRGDSLAHILAGDLIVALDDVGLLSVSVDDSRQRGFEACLVHTALGGMNVVCEGDHVLVIAVVILQGHLRDSVTLCAGEINHILVNRRLVLVEVAHKLPDTALIAHADAVFLSGALILERNGKAAV